MISVDGLTKLYGPRQAIKQLTFNVEQGEVVGFLGPNGAGKSTTMNILSCIIPASGGSAKIKGFDIFEKSLEIKKIIGYLPEIPPLYPDMIVSDYLRFAAGIRCVPKSKIDDAVETVLGKCWLQDVKHRIVGRLSKGFQQRVGLAQALIHEPEILILDEPTIGLDPLQILEIRKLIKELSKDRTIILSSHILPEITQICQRVIIINEGEIVAVDSLEGLTASLRKTEKIQLSIREGQNQAIEVLEKIKGVVSVSQNDQGEFQIDCELGSNLQDEIARTTLDNKWGLVELKQNVVSLEDVFLQLTTEETQV
jgi:ABC-2 type transport system ATP-binding protein